MLIDDLPVIACTVYPLRRRALSWQWHSATVRSGGAREVERDQRLERSSAKASSTAEISGCSLLMSIALPIYTIECL